MIIGIPKEIKPLEGRVALTPRACAALASPGRELLLQSGAGEAAGYSDAAYAEQGVAIVADAETLYRRAEMIVKVKEPIGPELKWLRREHRLFSFLHLAANRELARLLMKRGLSAYAYETLQVAGRTPVLEPMSEVAGRIAAQVGTTLLHRNHGGKGVLLGGVGESDKGRVLVIGAGVVGMAAASVTAAMGAAVTVLDVDQARLDRLASRFSGIRFELSSSAVLDDLLPDVDLLVGAVMVAGRRAPVVVERDQVARMATGSVIADVAIDQGGCVETSVATTWDEPVYRREGVLHFSVANMPGAVPRTASQALSARLAPFLEEYLEKGGDLHGALNVAGGEIVNPAVASEFSSA